MSTFVTLGSYRGFALNEQIQDLRAPNPRCCSDPGILCGNCAAMVLKAEGLIRCDDGRAVVGNAARLTRVGLPHEHLPPAGHELVCNGDPLHCGKAEGDCERCPCAPKTSGDGPGGSVANVRGLTRMGLPCEYLPPEKPRRPVGNAGRRRYVSPSGVALTPM